MCTGEIHTGVQRGKSERKRRLDRRRSKWENNIETDIRRTSGSVMDSCGKDNIDMDTKKSA